MLKLLKPSLVNVFLTGFTGSFILSILALFPLNSILPGKLSTPVILASTTSKALNPQLLSQEQTYLGLPVAKVESFSTPNSWGTVIYIPQLHKSSVAKADDKINNIAYKNQEEIYQILKFLTDKSGVNLVMVEGNLYGEVPAPQIAKIADKIHKRDALNSSYQSLKSELGKNSVNPELEAQLLKSIEDEIAKVNREVALEGAARGLKAEGKDIKLYGAENEQLHKQGLAIYQDFSYLSQRVNQLENVNGSLNTIEENSKPSFLLQSLLVKPNKPKFSTLKSQALSQGKNNIVQLIQNIEEAYGTLEKKPLPAIKLSSTNTSSKNTNPYAQITDVNEIKAKITQVKAQIEDVVINQRNESTAQNFAQALKLEGESVGVLQFGAGHGMGLVKKLQEQGLSVIVLTPNEVGSQL